MNNLYVFLSVLVTYISKNKLKIVKTTITYKYFLQVPPSPIIVIIVQIVRDRSIHTIHRCLKGIQTLVGVL